MKRIVGFCGIVCSECPVFTATQKNDDQEREKIALMFTKQYGKEYEKDDIKCAGCTTESLLVFNYCKTCKIRLCGKKRRLKNCASCPGYPCPRLSELFSKYPKAKTVLDEIRCKPLKNKETLER